MDNYLCHEYMRMNKLNISRVLLIAVILMIVALQSYWLNKLYKDEKQTLKKETNGLFRDVVYNMQVERFKADTLIYKQKPGNNLFVFNAVNALRRQVSEIKKDTGIKKKDTNDVHLTKVFVISNRNKDSNYLKNGKLVKMEDGPMPPELAAILAKEHERGLPPITDTSLIREMANGMGIKMAVTYNGNKNDTIYPHQQKIIPSINFVGRMPVAKVKDGPFARRSNAKVDVRFDRQHPEKAFIRMITDGKALDDTIQITQLDAAYKKELLKAGIPIRFAIKMGKDDSLHRKNTSSAIQFRTSPTIV